MGSRSDWDAVVRSLELGHLSPVVDRTFPLEQAAEAQRYLADAEQFGKVVLAI